MFAWRDNYISYDGGGAPAPTGDPYWSYVNFLQNNEVPTVSPIDSSSNQSQIYKILNARTSYRSPFATGNYGSSRSSTEALSQYQLPSPSSYNPGSGDFTIECYAYINAFPGNNTEIIGINSTLASSGQAVCRIVITNGGGVYFLCNTSTGGWINTSTSAAGTITTGSWFHFAGVRSGSNFRLYINGVVKLSYTYASSVFFDTNLGITTINNLPVGMGFTGASNCFVTMARYVVGTAVYSGTSTTVANFTPPTSPVSAISGTQLLLNFENMSTSGYGNNGTSQSVVATQDQSIVGAYMNSSSSGYSNYTPFVYTTYPGSIRLTGYIQSPSATVVQHTYGTNDFTIEGWFRFISLSITSTLIDQRTSVASQIVPLLYVTTGGSTRYQVNGVDVITGTTTITTNTWYHIAVSKVSGSTRLFIDGVQDGSTYTDSNNYTTSRITLGSSVDTVTNRFNGYLTNIRLSKGFGYYSSNFTPSTTPLPNNNTYTVLYITGTVAGFQNLSNNSNITISTITGSSSRTAGQLTLSQTQKKFGTQSQYYNTITTSGYQYVTEVSGSPLTFGTGDFTIEFWMYRQTNGIGVTQTIIAKGNPTTGWKLNLNSSNQLVLNSNNSNVITGSSTTLANTWYFVALSRVSGTFYMYIDTVSQGTYTAVVDYNQTDVMTVGAGSSGASGFYGYLDDIRITKGVGRYTTTCTVPTSSFPTSA